MYKMFVEEPIAVDVIKFKSVDVKETKVVYEIDNVKYCVVLVQMYITD